MEYSSDSDEYYDPIKPNDGQVRDSGDRAHGSSQNYSSDSDFNNGWDQGLEQWVRELRSRISAEVEIYSYMSSYTKNLNSWFTIVSAIISGVVGAEGTFEVAVEGEVPNWMRVMGAILSFIALCILSMSRAWNLVEVGSQSDSVKSRLLASLRNLDLQLRKRWQRRPPGEKYTKELLDEYSVIMLTAPTMYKKAIRITEEKMRIRYRSDQLAPLPAENTFSDSGDDSHYFFRLQSRHRGFNSDDNYARKVDHNGLNQFRNSYDDRLHSQRNLRKRRRKKKPSIHDHMTRGHQTRSNFSTPRSSAAASAAASRATSRAVSPIRRRRAHTGAVAVESGIDSVYRSRGKSDPPPFVHKIEPNVSSRVVNFENRRREKLFREDDVVHGRSIDNSVSSLSVDDALRAQSLENVSTCAREVSFQCAGDDYVEEVVAMPLPYNVPKYPSKLSSSVTASASLPEPENVQQPTEQHRDCENEDEYSIVEGAAIGRGAVEGAAEENTLLPSTTIRKKISHFHKKPKSESIIDQLLLSISPKNAAEDA